MGDPLSALAQLVAEIAQHNGQQISDLISHATDLALKIATAGNAIAQLRDKLMQPRPRHMGTILREYARIEESIGEVQADYTAAMDDLSKAIDDNSRAREKVSKAGKKLRRSMSDLDKTLKKRQKEDSELAVEVRALRQQIADLILLFEHLHRDKERLQSLFEDFLERSKQVSALHTGAQGLRVLIQTRLDDPSSIR